MNTSNERNIKLYNSPLELGIRGLVLLNVLRKSSSNQKNCDLNRLIIYDYILLHSEDVEGPKSVHPPTPYRSGELLIKSDILKKGLLLMKSKQLIEIVFDGSGISYAASDFASPFLEYFDSQYYFDLKQTAKWVINRFNRYSDDELNSFINNNINKWGSEFANESLFFKA